jgi:Cofilin/tropomyosin-type actin-binding protein
MQSGDRAGLHELMGNLSSGGLTMDPQVQCDWNWVQEEERNGEKRWITLTPHPSKPDNIISCSRGTHGYSEMVLSLNDSTIFFAITPMFMDGRLKLFFITYAGQSVSVIKKGKLSITKGKVYNAFTGLSGELYVTDKDELQEEAMLLRLRKLFGSSVSL